MVAPGKLLLLHKIFQETRSDDNVYICFRKSERNAVKSTIKINIATFVGSSRDDSDGRKVSTPKWEKDSF